MIRLLVILFLFFFGLALTQDTVDIYDKVVLYPNPARDYFNLAVKDTVLPRYVEVYDFSGKLVLRRDIGEGQTLVRIDVSLRKGSYIVILKDK